MQSWLRSKIDVLTEEFLGGGGYGAVFEAQYLVYLECLLAATGQNPSLVWVLLQQKYAQSISHTIEDRQSLVDALQRFRKKVEDEAWRGGADTARTSPAKSIDAVLDFFGGE